MVNNNVKIIKNLNYNELFFLRNDVFEYINENCKIKKNDKVAVKLNLVGSFSPHKGATTHPEVVKLIVEALLDFECQIIICEDINDNGVLVETGIKEVLDEYNLGFYNLRDYGFQSVEVDENEYMYSSLIKSCDVVISVPKYKTHMLTNFTGAIKNMYGCISKKQRKELHKAIDSDNFANIICSIYSIRVPDLIIMDAVVCMEGMGPSIGEPKYLGYLVLGTDGVYVDYYLSNVVGYEVNELQAIRYAIKRNMVKSSINKLEFIGGDLQDKVEGFIKIPIYKGKYRKKYIQMLKRTYRVDENLCLGCGQCAENCPFYAITFDKLPVFNREKCALCTCCMELCPVNAINYKR